MYRATSTGKNCIRFYMQLLITKNYVKNIFYLDCCPFFNFASPLEFLEASGEFEAELAADRSWALRDAASLRMCFSLSNCKGRI